MDRTCECLLFRALPEPAREAVLEAVLEELEGRPRVDAPELARDPVRDGPRASLREPRVCEEDVFARVLSVILVVMLVETMTASSRMGSVVSGWAGPGSLRSLDF